MITHEDMPLTAKDIDKLKVQAAYKMDGDIKRRFPRNDGDDHVGFKYNHTWRRAKLKPREIIGTNYDYWNMVVEDTIAEFRKYLPEILDPIADKIAKREGYSTRAVNDLSAIGVWQNTKPVPYGMPLEGPLVDVGLRPDFALFLENWDISDLPNIPVLKGIGITHLVARLVQNKWLGVHTVYAMPIKPTGGGEQRPTPNRRQKINLFPIIRIASRHYSAGRGGLV